MKIIQTIKENKTTIIITLAVSILLYYLQPLLNFIGTQLVNLFVAVSNKFSIYYFSLIAQNNPNLLSDYSASIIALLYWLLVINILMEPYISIQESERKLQTIERKLKDTESELPKEETTPELEIVQLKKKIRRRKTINNSVIAISFLVFLGLIIQQAIYSQVNFKNVSFQNRLIVLSVHLSEDKIKQLKAKWVQMKSFDDYKQLIDEISKHEKKFNVTK